MYLVKLSIFIAVLVISYFSYGQGDGSRAHLPAPTGVWGVNPKYLHLNQNIVPAGNILVENVDFTIDVVPTTFFHTFGIKEHYARVLFMVNPGKVTASAASLPAVPVRELSSSGFSDGFVAFEYGIIGAPALQIKEFMNYKPSFSLNGLFRLWYSGSYDSDKLVNLGTNRLTFEIGAPMSIPLSGNVKRAIWLEIFPSIQFFTDNNDPARSSFAQKTQQKPLFLWENHISRNFTDKLWAGIDLRYQYGGETVADGEGDDNLISALGGGIFVGYQALPYLGGYANYGTILAGANGAKSQMIRLSVVFTYLNMSKQ